ncbi:MAG: MBL fold metallo-hydrolase [Lachnospiraceae bacterium]|nr:MBL fold metallo-hydrolase [Lachnospiraceae bacterium]
MLKKLKKYLLLSAFVLCLTGCASGDFEEPAGAFGPDGGYQLEENQQAAGQNSDEEDVIESFSSDGEMTVTFLDVGQGDCTIIRTGEHCMVIDAGNNRKGETVAAYLINQGISKLDYLILTHPDEDHIGGADNVVRAVEVSQVMMPDIANDTVTYEETMQAIEEQEIPVIHPQPEEVYELGDAEFTILCPWPETIRKNDMNNASIGIRLVHGDNSFVMCGDAEEKSEKVMAEYFEENLECDVLKCGHHGSGTATSEEFLEAADPIWAVISCGEGNRYGHPHAEVLARLEDMDVQVYRTDKLGTITAISDGTEIYWSNE